MFPRSASTNADTDGFHNALPAATIKRSGRATRAWNIQSGASSSTRAPTQVTEIYSRFATPPTTARGYPRPTRWGPLLVIMHLSRRRIIPDIRRFRPIRLLLGAGESVSLIKRVSNCWRHNSDKGLQNSKTPSDRVPALAARSPSTPQVVHTLSPIPRSLRPFFLRPGRARGRLGRFPGSWTARRRCDAAPRAVIGPAGRWCARLRSGPGVGMRPAELNRGRLSGRFQGWAGGLNRSAEGLMAG